MVINGNTTVERINFFEDNFERLGDGSEGIVYRYSFDTALKIYRVTSETRALAEEIALDLMKLKTNRTLLPKEIVYDTEGNMVGYTKDFVVNYNHAFSKISGTNLAKELDLLRDDALYMAEHGYFMSDLHGENMIYDGSIHLTDPGKYGKNYVDEFTGEKLNPTKYNISALNGLIIEDIIGEDLRNFLSVSDTYTITDDLYTKEGYIGDVIKSDLVKSKTLRTYTRSLAKKYK